MAVETKACPTIEADLVAYLKMKYRNELPFDIISQLDLAREIGRQDVVRFLAAKQREQERLEAVEMRYNSGNNSGTP